MRVDLHVGPHQSAAGRIQAAAFARRDALAAQGILLLNDPAHFAGIPGAIAQRRPDVALADFDRLLEAARARHAQAAAAHSILVSSEAFFEADLRRRGAHEAAFLQFIDGLKQRGHEVRVVFVERDIEELLQAHALHQISEGNLQCLTTSPAPLRDYLETLVWLKGFFFEHLTVAHLNHGHLVGGAGDVLRNFVQLVYGIDPGATPGPDGAGAKAAPSDADIARGMLLAPVINWIELYGSVPRREMFSAPGGLKAPASDEALAAVARQVPMVRDAMKALARRAVEQFRSAQAPVAA